MYSRFERFSFAISSIYGLIRKLEREEMERYGLRGAYAQYLVAMRRRTEGVTAAELCEMCDKDKAAVSRIVSEMEAKGLVTRAGRAENPYRAKICLTEAGEAAAAFVSERATVAVELAGSGLSDEDREIFYAALDRIVGNLQKIGREGIPQESKN